MNRRSVLSLLPTVPWMGLPIEIPQPKPEIRLSDEDVDRIAKAVVEKLFSAPAISIMTTEIGTALWDVKPS